MHKFGFGVLGVGNIAQAHIDAIRRLPNARLVGVASRSTENAQRVANQHGVKVFENLKKMLSDDEVEIVCICTPSGAHRDAAIAAAQAGRHIVVEKPLEITAARARDIIEAADKASVKLATIFMSRFSNAHQRVKEAVTAGQLGRLLQGDAYVKWFRSQEYYDSATWRGTWTLDGGGALMNQAIHQLDLLLWLMGPIKEVFAYADILNHERLEVEDTLVAVLRYGNGALGTLTAATSLYPGQPKVLEIHGTEGTIQIRDDAITVWQLRGLSAKEQQEVMHATSGTTSGTFADPMAMSFENHRRQLEDFLRAIEQGTEPAIDGREGLRSVELVEAIYNSAKVGMPIKLP